MRREFKELAVYVKLHDGVGKAKINWKEMYNLFPGFDFIPSHRFGEYINFGDAYEQKIYDMTVRTVDGKECHMVYREFGDNDENTAYIQ